MALLEIEIDLKAYDEMVRIVFFTEFRLFELQVIRKKTSFK